MSSLVSDGGGRGGRGGAGGDKNSEELRLDEESPSTVVEAR